MAASVDDAACLVELGEAERALLEAPQRPIVLAARKAFPLSSGSTLNPALAALLRARTQPEQREPSTLENALTFRSREDLFGWTDEPMRQLQAEMLGALAAMSESH